MRTIVLLLVLLSGWSAAPAWSRPTEPQIGFVTLNGKACPRDRTQVVYSPDNKMISVLISGVELQAGPSRAREQAQCQAYIPIHVPKGKRVTVSAFDHRGGMILGEGASLEVALSNNVGVPNPRSRFTGWSADTRETFTGPRFDSYQLSQTVFVSRTPEGRNRKPQFGCGESFVLQLNAQYVLSSPNEDSLVQFDSIDGGMQYYLGVENCR